MAFLFAMLFAICHNFFAVGVWQMANAIANKKGICNGLYCCFIVCYTLVWQMANKKLKLCVQNMFISCILL